MSPQAVPGLSESMAKEFVKLVNDLTKVARHNLEVWSTEQLQAMAEVAAVAAFVAKAAGGFIRVPRIGSHVLAQESALLQCLQHFGVGPAKRAQVLERMASALGKEASVLTLQALVVLGQSCCRAWSFRSHGADRNWFAIAQHLGCVPMHW